MRRFFVLSSFLLSLAIPPVAQASNFARLISLCDHLINLVPVIPNPAISASLPRLFSPTDDTASFWPLNSRYPFDSLPPQFFVKLAEVHARHFEPTLLRGTVVIPTWGFRTHINRQLGIRLEYDGHLVTTYSYHLRDRMLRFDISIESNYRRSKLYEYLLGLALRDCPETQQIGARMNVRNSENARIFYRAAFADSLSLVRSSFNNLPVDQVLALRERVLVAAYLMPAMKARERNGFGRITKIILNPLREGIAFVVERGARISGDDLKLYIHGTSAKELKNRGETISLVSNDALSLLSLGDYPDFEPW